MKIRNDKNNNKKNAKKALALSMMSGALCFAMLAGSTYAWFSDSASGSNIIATGNLDVELKHLTADGTAEKVDANTKLFLNTKGKAILWEPGAVATETFVVENVGSLNLVYDLALNAAEDGRVATVDDVEDTYFLENFLKVAMLPATVAENGTVTPVAMSYDAETGKLLADGEEIVWGAFGEDGKMSDTLLPEKTSAYTVVVYWEPQANKLDNVFNLNNGTPEDGTPAATSYELTLNIELGATQATGEFDSINDQYDAKAHSQFANGGVENPDEGNNEDTFG